MKNIIWIVILFILCLSGYGLFLWKWNEAKKIKQESLKQIQNEVLLIIEQRDSIESAKKITLDELKQDKITLDKLILEMEKNKQSNITIENAKKKLNSI